MMKKLFISFTLLHLWALISCSALRKHFFLYYYPLQSKICVRKRFFLCSLKQKPKKLSLLCHVPCQIILIVRFVLIQYSLNFFFFLFLSHRYFHDVTWWWKIHHFNDGEKKTRKKGNESKPVDVLIITKYLLTVSSRKHEHKKKSSCSKWGKIKQIPNIVICTRPFNSSCLHARVTLFSLAKGRLTNK